MTESERSRSARTVVLFDGKLPSGLTSHAEVSVDAAGDLTLAAQDLGGRLEELFR